MQFDSQFELDDRAPSAHINHITQLEDTEDAAEDRDEGGYLLF